jgi:hypothetical protein
MNKSHVGEKTLMKLHCLGTNSDLEKNYHKRTLVLLNGQKLASIIRTVLWKRKDEFGHHAAQTTAGFDLAWASKWQAMRHAVLEEGIL